MQAIQLDTKGPVENVTNNQVKITKSNPPGWAVSTLNKALDYIRGIFNSFHLIKDYRGVNAFHDFLQNQYQHLPADKLKVVELPFIMPSTTQVCKRVIGIANPVILQELRKIPRAETVSPDYFQAHSTQPRISGGRAFGSVLEAIGMGILTAGHTLHDPFLQKMKSLLAIHHIDESPDYFKEDLFKKQFINSAIKETQSLLAQIEMSIEEGQKISLDFRFYALKIFLYSFYPNAHFKDDWIQGLSQTIEEVSNLAFQAIMNPYLDVEQLRLQAEKKLDPYIKVMMQENQAFYLGQDYVAKNSEEILKQILISLIFAGGDNIKKYLDHIFVEFGRDEIRDKWLNQTHLDSAYIKDLIIEVGRKYTTIHAQPGLALDDFTIEYKDQKIFVRAGDELHYTTWMANIDKSEWGEDAETFDPVKHKKLYTRLNALSTFGAYRRRCEGKYVTLAIIHYLVCKVLEQYRWDAFVDERKNDHPTELNFNHGVVGRIKYQFRKNSCQYF
jgi:hypothetical protein